MPTLYECSLHRVVINQRCSEYENESDYIFKFQYYLLVCIERFMSSYEYKLISGMYVVCLYWF